MACVIWVENTESHVVVDPLVSGGTIRGGQKITIPNKTICKVSFCMARQGVPTGTVYARIRKTSDDSIIETSSTTYLASDLTLQPTYTFYDFTFNSLINEEVYILVEFSGGESGKRVYLSLSDPDITGDYTHYISSYTDYSQYDMRIKIYEEEAAPLGMAASIAIITKMLGIISLTVPKFKPLFPKLIPRQVI